MARRITPMAAKSHKTPSAEWSAAAGWGLGTSLGGGGGTEECGYGCSGDAAVAEGKNDPQVTAKSTEPTGRKRNEA